jgi:hypothetical protein
VNLDKLAKQLRRDLAANPKKAAILGLMVLVALYFWGPLVWTWMKASGSKRSSKLTTASLILTDDPAEPTTSSRQRGGAKFRWERVRQLTRNDPHMVSAKFDAAWVDPFSRPAVAETSATAGGTPKDDAATAAAGIAGAEPSDIGIVLGGVMIGPRNRVATINGEACHEGDVIEVTDKMDKSISRRFRVVKITRQGVELEIGGRTLTLDLKQPKLAHGDDIERGRPKGSN